METGAAPPIRRDFLTVLCALTIMASSFGIFSNLANYRNADVISEMTRESLEMNKEQAMEKAKTSGQQGMIEKLFSGANELLDTRKQKQNNLLNMMANALTLAGGVMMFRLRRTGYGIYALGMAVWILAPLVIYGAANYMGIGMTAMLGLIGGLFLLMYSRQLKYMV